MLPPYTWDYAAESRRVFQESSMIYRIYRTERYGNDTSASREFPSSLTANCTPEQAGNLAEALSTYSDAGCHDQFLVECPECGHRDLTECWGGAHVLEVKDLTRKRIAQHIESSVESALRCVDAI